MTENDWTNLILHHPQMDSAAAWNSISKSLLQIAKLADGISALHNQTVFPDRLLSDAAFELWRDYPCAAKKTSARLVEWCDHNKAVLILDALSLRELPLILGGANARNIPVKTAEITFSEAPSETNVFAQAIGAASRSALKDNGKSRNFKLFNANCYTDSVSIPFADVRIEPEPNIVLWHSFLDDLIHNGKSADEIHIIARREFSGDDFWKLVNKLRQGRELVITGDHGYGNSAHFSTEVREAEAADILKDEFKAQRYMKNNEPLKTKFMPPLLVQNNGYCIVTGQRKWRVQGGFPKVCHGGLSLLEVSVPWIEIGRG